MATKKSSKTSYSYVTSNGKTTYYKKVNGKKTEISKDAYKKATTPTYSKKVVDGKTTYYEKDPQTGKTKKVSKAVYNNRTSKNPQPYKDGGKYYDKNGKEISKNTYNSQVKKINDKKIIEKTTVGWEKQSDFQDRYRPNLEDLAKKIANNKNLTLQDLKNIEDNAEYIGTRDRIAKSLADGTYYNQDTDPYAQQYRQDYIRQGQRAMDDTMANLARNTGGLASSYAAAVAQGKYNDYMDNLASKLLDLRSLAEATARNNVSMYDTMNNEYRAGQMQNNDVISANNASRTAEWNAYMGQLQNALNAYGNLSNTDYQRWVQGQQMYQNQKQFDDDLAYRYAALEARQTPASGVAIGGSGGGGGYGGSGGGYGGDGGGVNQVAVAAKQAPLVSGDTKGTTIGEWAKSVQTQEKIDDALRKANGW